MDIIRAEGLVYPQEGVNITFPCHVRAEILSWVSTIPPQKLLVTLFPGRRKKVPHILWSFLLDIKFRFFVYLTQSKASFNHSTGAGPKIQSHHESLRAYLAPSRKGSRDPHQFPLLSAWKKG
jgi:hypothetical protein